jgi:hypothetical protein
MSRLDRFMLTMIGIFLLLGLTIRFVFLSIMPDPFADLPCGSFLGRCEEKLNIVAKSPNGNYQAGMLTVNCGATTDFSMRVGLQAGGRPFTSTTDGSSMGETVFGQTGTCGHAQMWWKDNRHLVIRIPRREKFYQSASWRDVKIIYVDPEQTKKRPGRLADPPRH